MTRCLDIHTHHAPPRPEAVVSIEGLETLLMQSQFYSAGIHPWNTTTEISGQTWDQLERIAESAQVVAIGECGIDKIKGGPLFRQMNVLKRQIELSEQLEKPLIIHDVKAHDIITGLRRDLKPRQKWVVHGLRAKPTVMRMLTDAGIYVSYGEYFNEESVRLTPRGMLLAETDESLLPIEEIIARISKVAGEDLTETIRQNTEEFLGILPG